MSLFFFPLAIPLLLSPLWTHELYQTIYYREKTQIALDNGAIRLGQADRKVIRALIRLNKQVNRLEQIHHPLHVCSRVMRTPHCVAQDKFVEQKIFLLRAQGFAIAQGAWSVNPSLARRAALRLGTLICSVQRPSRVPLVDSRCPVCHLKTRWEWNRRHLPYRFSLESCSKKEFPPLRVRVGFVGDTLMQENWNYRIEWNDEASI